MSPKTQAEQKNQIDKAAALVEAAQRSGATACDAVVVGKQALSAAVRLGKVEAVQSSESDDLSLRVFVGQKSASISANLMAEPAVLAEKAVAMAKVSPENHYEGLADAARLLTTPRDLDLFDSFVPDSDVLINDALTMEEAALDVSGVNNSGGATAAYGTSGFVLVTSHGFSGAYRTSHFARSVSAVAGQGNAMERDYDYSAHLHFADLAECCEIGHRAGERAVKRLGAQQAETGCVDVVFDRRVARSIAAHLAAMVNGAAVARQTSLLKNQMGRLIMRPGVNVRDNPFIMRGSGSRPFDGEGVEGQTLQLVDNGVLQNWLLSSASARELGLETNGHGARSSSGVSAANSNFAIEPGEITPQAMVSAMKKGFYVTELFGQGVDLVTGQYSRGASGYWIEDGAIAYPVSGVTLASDLTHMLAHLTPACDLDRSHAIAAPTLQIEGMTLAGK